MRLHMLLGLILGLQGGVTARAEIVRGMSDEKVREAIAFGRNAASELDQYDLLRGSAYLVNFDTPFLRVAQFSRAMKIQNAPASEGDVSPKLAAQEVHLYAHARVDGTGGALPNIDYVVIVRPGADGRSETILPTTLQSFVRRVPPEGDFNGPTRIARSVKAVFPLRAMAVGNEVRLTFENRATQSFAISSEVLARVR